MADMDIAATHPLIFGVDFSGAAEAGKKIWIASGREQAGQLLIEQCCRAAELPAGGRGRAVAYQGLRALIAGQENAVFGIDVPFGIAAGFMGEAAWREFLIAFPSTYLTADSFRAGCRINAEGREARRVADHTPRTPFAPANLRLYRQTYHALADVLAPLVEGDQARVLPMQEPAVGKPVLVEICPALTVRALGPFGPYKGRTPAHAAQRAAILARFYGAGLAPLDAGAGQRVLNDSEGDALDSIVAAWTVWRIRHRLHLHPEGDWHAYAREGYVYSVMPAEIPH